MKEQFNINLFCSENFICENCARNEYKVTKGFTRYDSLVLCEKHNNEFRPVINKLNTIFENNPNVKIITSL